MYIIFFVALILGEFNQKEKKILFKFIDLTIDYLKHLTKQHSNNL